LVLVGALVSGFFSAGDGDAGAAAGEELAAGAVGLALVAGVALLGDDGDEAAGAVGDEAVLGEFEFELSVGSVAQPAARAIETVARITSAMRLMKLMFRLLI
jgi:hypothetical protein